MPTAAARSFPVLLCGLFCSVLFSAPLMAREALGRLSGLGPVDYFTIQSETLNRDFHLYVRKPLDYDETDCDWPVVYLLDGGILFPMLAPLQLMMEIDGVAPPVVMVGISYGGLGFANGNFRSTDYTAPADEPEFYGGAFAYQDFLAKELIPRIEADYRVDQANSLVMGQSLGGQFTLLSALNRPDLFGHYLSINPALHRNLAFFQHLEPVPRATPTPLLITRATGEQGRYSGPLQQWLATWAAAGDESLDLEQRWLADEFHASSAPEAYQSAMAWWAPGSCSNRDP